MEVYYCRWYFLLENLGVVGHTQQTESTSASLIERAVRFEPEAWNRLSAIYGPLVYGWCRRAGLQEADAADVLREVFRAVVTGIEKFVPENATGGFRGWLFGITRHKLTDHYREKGKHGTPRGDGDPEIASLPEPTELDETTERALVLHAALDAIRDEFSEQNWGAFCRTAIQQESAVDVAKDLAMTPGAVRQAKFRVLRRLRRELEGL